jgi:hypothetical protein
MNEEIQTMSPGTVKDVKIVKLAFVSYTGNDGKEMLQLCVVGDNRVLLLDGKLFGISATTTPSGLANTWLTEGILAKLKEGK